MEEEKTMEMEGGESKTLIILKTIPVYPISMSADELSATLGMSRADVNSRIRKCSTNYLFAELKTAGKSIILLPGRALQAEDHRLCAQGN